MAEKQNNVVNKKMEEDATLVWEFISKDLNQRCLQNTSLSDLTKSISYNRLADLLRLLKNETVLDILDKKWNSEAMYMVNDLRQFSFEGMWLDSIEKLFVNNLRNSFNSFAKLEDCDNRLNKEQMFLKESVMYSTFKLKNSTDDLVAIINGNLLATESSHAISKIIEVNNNRQTMETFIQKRKAIQLKIKLVLRKMKVVLEARAKLDALEVDFSSPTVFRSKTGQVYYSF